MTIFGIQSMSKVYARFLSKFLSTKVAVMMSGGIDSSVAALLLKKQGFDVIGVFMRNWNKNDEIGQETCPIESDYQDMKDVCKRLQIPSHQVEFSKQYWNDVFDPFLKSYQTGYETPNPDAMCNKYIKFKAFRHYVKKYFNIDVIATGHYAQIKNININNTDKNVTDNSYTFPLLFRGKDAVKDQSYFLSMTSSEYLCNTMFPIGFYTKTEVRHIASQSHLLSDLNICRKKESVGVCFIGARNMKSFLMDYIQYTPGHFIDIDTGHILGEHKGVELYTVGEKAKIKNMLDKYYVVGREKKKVFSDKFSKQNSICDTNVYVGKGKDHPAIYCNSFWLESNSISWMNSYLLSILLSHASVFCSIELKQKIKNNFALVSSNLSHLSYPENMTYCGNEIVVSLLSSTLYVQYKHMGVIAPCQLEFLPKSNNFNYEVNYDLKVTFLHPQKAISPGQVAAFYLDSICIGGGTILETSFTQEHLTTYKKNANDITINDICTTDISYS